jgi:hypothetical protein
MKHNLISSTPCGHRLLHQTVGTLCPRTPSNLRHRHLNQGQETPRNDNEAPLPSPLGNGLVRGSLPTNLQAPITNHPTICPPKGKSARRVRRCSRASTSTSSQPRFRKVNYTANQVKLVASACYARPDTNACPNMVISRSFRSNWLCQELMDWRTDRRRI